MTTLHVFIVLLFAFSLGNISDVNGDCTNENGVTCSTGECCYDDIPDILGDGNSTVNPIQDCYTNSYQITYRCDGELLGPPFNICNNGNWNFQFSSTCEGTTSCPAPTAPTNGAISAPQNEPADEYDLYERIYYTCDAGYSLVGPTDAVCESGGVWNPSTVPTCAAECTTPSVSNGYVLPDQPTFSNGEVLTYSCDTNYTLVGVSTATCRNGVFDPSNTPACYEMCNPPVVANSDYSTQRTPVDHASTITISCDPGYSTGTGTDKDLTCSDGIFDESPPVCYGDCPRLSDTFDNGVRSGDETPYYHDEQVSYTCNSGYTLEGSPTITCNNGNWSDDEPVCRANCAVDPVLNSDFSSGGSATHDTSFVITCDDGYSTGTSRTTTLTCNDGTISPDTLPTCSADCVPPVVPYSDYQSQQDPVFHTTNFSITCWANYSTGPDSQTTLLSCNDGNLEGDTPVCYENCDEISDPENGEITGGGSPFYHLEEVSFACFANYTLIGESTVTCNNGSYDNDPPVCLAQCKPPVIANSNATSSSPLVESGGSITVTCDTGYSNGQSQSSTSTCNDGVLQPEIPLCYEDCAPPIVRNSNYDTQEEDVYHTTPITITCDVRYSTGSQVNTTLTCDDGSFNDDVPTCYADCTPAVVHFSDYQTQQPDVFHSTEFTVTCWSNYSTGPDSQETNVVCDNGTLSDDDFACYENCVVPIVEDSDYSNQRDDVFHFVSFNITCNDGYSNGEEIYTSLSCNDGALSDVDPTCYANCPDFGSIEDGTYTGDSPPFYHTETVTIACNANHSLVGEETITCNDGNWSSPIPSCEADCLPPVIENSDFNTSKPLVTHGTDIVIVCDEGYSTGQSVTQTVRCDDGVFVPEPLICLLDCVPPIVENSDYATQQDPVFTSQSFVITCDTNYTVGNADSTATTTLTCTDGELDLDDVKCYENCPTPGELMDGTYEYDGDGFYHGTVVNYYCNPRFDLIGESEIVCNDGEWSAATPNCTDTSAYDLIMLTCGPTSMEVEIPIILLQGIEVNDIGMDGNLSCMGYIVGDMMRVNTTLSGCGTNKTENATYDTYTNRVINNYYDDVITRVVDVQIPLKCSYPRNEQVRAVRYAVLDYVLGKDLEETGTYTTTFGIYNTSSFKHRYADGGAVDLDINDELFFQLELVTDVADNQLVAQDCWATPSESTENTISHDLVANGCAVDDTLQFLTDNGESTIVQFKLKSFRFVGDNDKEAYVHCEVFVCHDQSTDDFCTPTCTSSRSRRRSGKAPSPWERAKLKRQMVNRTISERTEEERVKRASAPHDPVVKYVRAGPFHWHLDISGDTHVIPVVHADESASNILAQSGGGQISESSSAAWMHSVIGMGVVITVFTVILLVVVKHYRRRLRREYRYQHLDTRG